MIVAAYAASLLVVERLFRIVKPKLLMLPWFARSWSLRRAIRKSLQPLQNRGRSLSALHSGGGSRNLTTNSISPRATLCGAAG